MTFHDTSARALRATLERSAVALLIAALCAPAVHAQALNSSTKSTGTCGNAPSYRVPVYVALDMTDREHPQIPPDLANLLQAVADRADTLLGAKPGVLPRAEVAMTGRGLNRDLIVEWHRDGRLTPHVESDTDPRFDARDAAGARLLAHALDDAQKAGEVFLTWPENASSDSIGFRISLRASDAEVSGKVDKPPMTLGVPVMSLDVKSEEPVMVLKAPTISYPMHSEASHATGVVLMQFVVDTSGRADVSTIRDLWPANKPRPVDETSEYYREFRRAAERAIADARYVPAKIGGCPVRQAVQQPFRFALR